jgi:hypothetical protein
MKALEKDDILESGVRIQNFISSSDRQTLRPAFTYVGLQANPVFTYTDTPRPALAPGEGGEFFFFAS